MLWTKVSGNVVHIGCYVQGPYSKKMHVVAMHKGFKVIDFLWINFGCYLHGFQVIATASVAICKGFKATEIVCIVSVAICKDSK